MKRRNGRVQQTNALTATRGIERKRSCGNETQRATQKTSQTFPTIDHQTTARNAQTRGAGTKKTCVLENGVRAKMRKRATWRVKRATNVRVKTATFRINAAQRSDRTCANNASHQRGRKDLQRCAYPSDQNVHAVCNDHSSNGNVAHLRSVKGVTRKTTTQIIRNGTRANGNGNQNRTATQECSSGKRANATT